MLFSALLRNFRPAIRKLAGRNRKGNGGGAIFLRQSFHLSCDIAFLHNGKRVDFLDMLLGKIRQI